MKEPSVQTKVSLARDRLCLEKKMKKDEEASYYDGILDMYLAVAEIMKFKRNKIGGGRL